MVTIPEQKDNTVSCRFNFLIRLINFASNQRMATSTITANPITVSISAKVTVK